jgi:hypothetical protein
MQQQRAQADGGLENPSVFFNCGCGWLDMGGKCEKL